MKTINIFASIRLVSHYAEKSLKEVTLLVIPSKEPAQRTTVSELLHHSNLKRASGRNPPCKSRNLRGKKVILLGAIVFYITFLCIIDVALLIFKFQLVKEFLRSNSKLHGSQFTYSLVWGMPTYFWGCKHCKSSMTSVNLSRKYFVHLNRINSPLIPVGSIAQWVERRSRNPKVWVRFPLETTIFRCPNSSVRQVVNNP